MSIRFLEGQRTIWKAQVTVTGNSQTSIVPANNSNPSLLNLALRQATAALGILTQIGTQFDFEICADVTTAAAAMGTLALAVKYGATTLATKTSPTLPASLSHETLVWKGQITVRAVGVAGTMEMASTATITNSTTGAPFSWAVNTAATPVTIAQNAAGLLDFLQTFSAAATNTNVWTNGRVQAFDLLEA